MTKDTLSSQVEEWRDFPGYPSHEVSSLGRVRRKAYILEGARDPKGYLSVVFYPEGRKKPKRLSFHRAVATAFLGRPSSDDLVVAHLNGKPSDNRVENLAWATPKVNSSHKWQHGTQRHGESVPQAKLTVEQVREIRRRGDAAESPTRIARDYGVKRESVRDIINRKNWRWLKD